MKKFLLGFSVLSLCGCVAYEDTAPQEMEVREVYIDEEAALPQPQMQPVQPRPVIKYREEHRPVHDLDFDHGITPQVYAIAATRATNKMLDQTADIYETDDNVFLYIADAEVKDSDLPAGYHAAEKITREIIEGGESFKVTQQRTEADYQLKILIGNGGSKESPVIVYKLILLNKDGIKEREWTEAVRRVRNDDRSWW